LPEWLVEKGIGEIRRVLVDGDEIIETRILREATVPAGAILHGRLVATGRLTIVGSEGQEYLLPKGAPGVAEGAKLSIEVTREALGGAEPWKRALARVSDGQPCTISQHSAAELPWPAPRDRLEEAGWSELVDEARSGIVRFAGGELRMSLTPAMTLIDVDGHLPPEQLALAGARAAARAIRRHGIGGSIGLDLPTIAGKTARQAVAETMDNILPQPFERTAVNGFGFIQIVRPRRHASLFELAADRAAFEARVLLRRAARETGAITLIAAPAVLAAIEHDWWRRLAEAVGGSISLRPDSSLAMSAGYAQRA